MMTLDEMKLAVCEKLPELIVWRQGNKMSKPYHRKGFFWSGIYDTNNLFREIHWPTEGLQVCHEAEKLLGNGQNDQYLGELMKLVFQVELDWISGKSKTFNVNSRYPWHATYEQRLEALCRVWWPERFKN